MGAILLQVALHMAIMLGRAHWHCWSPMHPRPFGTSEPMPRALDPVGCAWTEGSYAQLDILPGEAVDEGPFMVCHRALSSYEDSNRIVCIPRILRAPECKRGW